MFNPDYAIKELRSKGFEVIGKEFGFRSWAIWTKHKGRTWFTQVTSARPSRISAIAIPVDRDNPEIKNWNTTK